MAETHFGQDYFNMVEFIKQLIQRPKHRGGRLAVKFMTEDSPLPAKVSFDPLTLHVRVDVWRAAQTDEPWARWILAHECGHLILHDNYAKGFAIEGSARIPLDEQERSAEWQADRFADYLLMPTEILERLISPHDVAVRAGVEPQHAFRRFQQVSQFWERHGKQYGEQCCQCYNFSLSRIGCRTKCSICGLTQRLDL